MKLRAARRRFYGLLAANGLELASLMPADGLDLMTRSYRTDRFRGCDPDRGGDMLSCRWGVLDRGRGEWFEFEVARELNDLTGGRTYPRRLRLVFRFTPDDELRSVGDGILRCPSPREVEAFRQAVAAMPAYGLAASRLPRSADLSFDVLR